MTAHPTTSRLRWYLQRARQMSPAEMAWRARDQALHVTWSHRQVSPGQILPTVDPLTGRRTFTSTLPPDAAARVPEDAGAAILEAADRLMRGEWEVLGVARTDMVAPDWFHDPVTGRRLRRPAFPSGSGDCRR